MKTTALTAIAIAVLGLSACKKDDKGKAAPAPAPAPVGTDPTKAEPHADPVAKPAPPPEPAKPPEVAPFTSADGGYAIKFPSPPTEQTQTGQSAVGPIDIHIAAVDAGNKAFLVSWQEQPAKASKDPKVVLDGQRDGMMSSFPGGKILEQKDITIGTNPGRSMTIRMATPDATQFTRVYLVGNRMYQIAAIEAGAGDAAAAAAFLDSFELTKK